MKGSKSCCGQCRWAVLVALLAITVKMIVVVAVAAFGGNYDGDRDGEGCSAREAEALLFFSRHHEEEMLR